MMEYKRTNGQNKDFIENCRRLDADLDQRVGKEIQRSKYEKYNQLDKINEAIVVYENNVLVGAGSIRYYDEINVELKRIYISPAFRERGLGTKLEFERIPNYGPYENMPESLCMAKDI